MKKQHLILLMTSASLWASCGSDDYRDPHKVRDPAHQVLTKTTQRQDVFVGKWNVSEQSDSFTTVKNGQQIRVKMWKQALVEYKTDGSYVRNHTLRLKDASSQTILETAGTFGGKWRFDESGKWQEMIENCELHEVYSEFGAAQKSSCDNIEKGKFVSVAQVDFRAFNAKQISFQAQDPNGLKFMTIMKKVVN